MTRIQYTKAVRENTNVLVGLAGGTGSGKTYSAFEVATGICAVHDNAPFAVVDTEARRALHYADQYDFEHVELKPPFEPKRYLDAIRKLAARGFPAVVIDSASHEWEGEGGVLDMADRDNRKPPSNWIRPKAEHKKFMNGLLQCGTNLIFCLRAQEKINVRDATPEDRRAGVTGKIVIESRGWMPICEKRFMFEMTISFTFDPTRPGIVDLDLPHKLQDQHRMAFPPGEYVSRRGAAMLGAWARGQTIDTPDKALWDRARRAANEGMETLRLFAETQINADERAKLRPIGAELNRTAKAADANLGHEWERPRGGSERQSAGEPQAPRADERDRPTATEPKQQPLDADAQRWVDDMDKPDPSWEGGE